MTIEEVNKEINTTRTKLLEVFRNRNHDIWMVNFVLDELSYNLDKKKGDTNDTNLRNGL